VHYNLSSLFTKIIIKISNDFQIHDIVKISSKLSIILYLYFFDPDIMKSRYSIIFSAIFFAIFFICVLLFIKPELIYHSQLSGFSFDKYSLVEYLAYPGGTTECISLFLFQFNIYPVAGALVYTLLTFLIVFILTMIINYYGSSKLDLLLAYLPAVFIGGLLTNYSFHLVFILILLIMLLFFYAFISIMKRFKSALVRIISFVILSALIYYMSGGLAFLIFSLLAFIYVLTKSEIRSIIVAIAIFVMALALPYLAYRYVFMISLGDAYLKLIPPYYYAKVDFILYGIYFYMPIVLLVKKAVGRVPESSAKTAPQPEKMTPAMLVQYIFLILALILVVHFMFQKDEKYKILVDYYAYNKQWDKLLEVVTHEPSKDRLITFHTNRALYHKGRLCESMFDYPQVWGVDGLFLSRYMVPGELLPTAELYIDLGHVNDAIHWGNEAFVQNEDSPQIIEQLIIANIILGNYKPAQLYINSLRKYLFFRRKACNYDRYIRNGDLPDIDILVKEKRSILPVNDFAVNREQPDHDMIRLLEDNHRNKMAFEYLMAYYLLNNDLGSFIKHINYADNFNYVSVPKSYEEALTLYAFEMQKRGKVMENLRLSKKTLGNFADYLGILKKYEGDRAKAKRELEKKYGNTYWFYIHYISPVTTKKKIIIK